MARQLIYRDEWGAKAASGWFQAKWGPKSAGGWFQAGNLLCLAADLNSGNMRVSVVEADGTRRGCHCVRFVDRQSQLADEVLLQNGQLPIHRAFSLAPMWVLCCSLP
jgi:hypothetical protein